MKLAFEFLIFLWGFPCLTLIFGSKTSEGKGKWCVAFSRNFLCGFSSLLLRNVCQHDNQLFLGFFSQIKPRTQWTKILNWSHEPAKQKDNNCNRKMAISTWLFTNKGGKLKTPSRYNCFLKCMLWALLRVIFMAAILCRFRVKLLWSEMFLKRERIKAK